MTYPEYDCWERFVAVFSEIIRNLYSSLEKHHPNYRANLIEPNLTTESCTIIEEINPNSDLCIEPDSTTESHQEPRPKLKSTSELSNARPNLTTNPSTITNLEFEEINTDSSEHLTADDLIKEMDYNEALNLLRNMEPYVLVEGLQL
ncbi:hypothetical protein TNIN_468871 [Trichonephila inaurata madagascariensis]|uniref:Uncharacterized protein n=1 Tax=Trichonephila inaurata madagascariensis TaxID=2747483 RepID=A0A8X6YSW2_9ARAC|nr:hypothetical protein TNIN_468871 [Trichonephila inaurata madagascariensis]